MSSMAGNGGRCGCNMVSDMTLLKSFGHRGRRRWFMKSTESADGHEMESWWCPECREAHWECAQSGYGRQCGGANFPATRNAAEQAEWVIEIMELRQRIGRTIDA